MYNYFISIGGSGAKVLESVVHLSMAGIMPHGKIKVFAVDPDNTNGNLNRSGRVLREYNLLEKLNIGGNTPLFGTKLEIIRPFPWSPVTPNQTLSSLVKFNNANTPSGELYAALYTRKERETSLDVGFRGHPSIGAAAFAQQHFQNSDWKKFVEDITQKVNQGQPVKVFMAGSIFGGTGAAGIPTISRLLKESVARNLQDKLSIGGVLVLPYFNFREDSRDNFYAHSRNFLMNTKAAIVYYSQLQDDAFASLYFSGDSVSRVEKFSIGSSEQENGAHIVDLYAALAAANFFHSGGANKFNVVFHSDSYKFTWSDFPKPTKNSREHFVKFARFIFAYVYWIKPHITGLIEGMTNADDHPWFSRLAGNISTDAQNFGRYTESFAAWLKQLETLDGREIQLIKSYMFEANPCRITDETALKDNFASFGYTDDRVTLESVNDVICDDGLSFLGRLRKTFGGGNRNTLDFGQFLRRLYDACEVRK